MAVIYEQIFLTKIIQNARVYYFKQTLVNWIYGTNGNLPSLSYGNFFYL